MNVDKDISVLEFKKLLTDLKEKRPDICIRIRIQGEMWNTTFTRVLSVAESGAILFDETANKFFRISNLKNVIQFEIDHGFQIYRPHYHYNVILLDSEFK